MHKPSIRLTTAICAAALAIGAHADTYIFGGESNESNVGSASSPVSWSDTSYWTPSAVPGGTDEVNWTPSKTGSHRQIYVSLDGDYAIGSLTTKYRTIHLYKDANVAAPVTFTINTQLGGDDYQQCHEVTDGVKLVLPVGSTLICSKGGHTQTGISVASGGEADIYGAVQTRVMTLEVGGGTLLFAPTSYTISSWGRSDNDHDEINISGGTASFPNGITMTGTSSTPNNQINQSGGTVSFGGNFTSALPWTYTWSDGTLAITDDSTFGANIALAVPASAAVSLNIATGKTFSAPGLNADATASITVTGGGTFSIAPTTAPIILQNGSLGLATSGTYDLSNVSVGSGAAIITLTAFGATINSLPAALAGATFVADLSGAVAGTVILNSSDPAVLSKVKTDLDVSVPAGMSLVVSGTTLSLEAQSAYVFSASGDLADGTDWDNGSLPPAGEEVSIEGNGVVATYTTGTIPAWASITVKDGATLRVSGDATLPPIILNKSATLVVDNNATMTLANAADLSGIATANQVPVLSIESGATLSVPGGMKFSNVDIDLEGTITVTTPGGVTFGYAAAGETTYFGFTSNGGTISLTPGSGSYNTSPFEFCCPASGGTVNAVGSLALIDTTILPVYERSGNMYPLTVAYQIGFNLGVNNPANALFEVVFDNTQWGVLGSILIKGGATFRLANGGIYQNFESIGYWGRYAQISENGRLVVGHGCEFRLNALGDYGSNPLEVNPSSANYPVIIVEDGGVFETYRFSGNGKGVFVASNSVYRIYQPSIYDEHYSESSGTTTIYDTANIPFMGFAAVELADDSTLTFSTRNKVFWDDGQFDETSGDRVVTLADVPITGGGSIVVSNANANVFGVIVQSGANTATGTASVTAPAAGLGATTLYFADGANWAGSVVADGNVVLTNLTDGASSTSVTFGSLDLAENFPIRVWNNAGTLANDKINVDAYVANGGKLTPVLVNGDVWPSGTSFEVGKIAKGAELPPLAKNWVASVKSIDNDDDYDMLCLRYFKGTQIILR
ncbi:MAG: hypothetical protein ILM98_03865 [Kiritimatiellae bacterium]|nr:hypothetical protein [Kiritimatiellia bacterium]